jgi:hypothetical protein
MRDCIINLAGMEKIPDWIQACVAFVAVCVAIWEYYKHRRESRLQLAQALIGRLETDELLFFSSTTLDWGAGLIPVPPSWQAFVGSPKVTFDLDLIRDALNPGLSAKTATDPTRLLYRHSFVHLFNFLERIAYLVKNGAIDLEDLQNLVWLSKQLRSWQYAPKEIREKIFGDAIAAWYPDEMLNALIKRLAAES